MFPEFHSFSIAHTVGNTQISDSLNALNRSPLESLIQNLNTMATKGQLTQNLDQLLLIHNYFDLRLS